MDNYIIRIYRQEKDNPDKMVGIVEKVGEEGKKAFTRYDELWEMLNASQKKAGKRAAVTKGKKE